MRNKEILKKKKLKSTDSLMDNVGSEELAANLFRATQAEAKIKREQISGQDKASKAHYKVGKDIRGLIQKMWGTMPEELAATEHIKETRKRLKQQEKLSNKK